MRKRNGFVCETCGARFTGWHCNANRFCSRQCYRAPRALAFVAKARKFWDAGRSLTNIGRQMGVSRNVIAGIRFRHKFPAREVPPNFQRGLR